MTSEPERALLFLLNPPNSGSTALALTILSSARAASIEPTAEGQKHPLTRPWMLKKDRWDPQILMPWPSVREIWLQAWSEAAAQKPSACILVEKSPPNLIRAEQIAAHFPGAPS